MFFELFSCVTAVYSCCVSLQAIEAAFNQTVRTVCQAQASQFPGLTPELQLLKTTMTFVRLGAKSCPNLRNVALAFINRNLGDWITQQGGWVGQILVLNSKCSFFTYIYFYQRRTGNCKVKVKSYSDDLTGISHDNMKAVLPVV